MASDLIIKSVQEISKLPHVDSESSTKFESLYATHEVYTKGESNPHHHCSFFLPFNRESSLVYLGHHKKAADWIPPGGHIEPGETNFEAVIREFKEELAVEIKTSQIELFDLSVKPIGRPASGCLTHYDIWHLVHIDPIDFSFDRGEYHDAKWINLNKTADYIRFNPDYLGIVNKLSR